MGSWMCIALALASAAERMDVAPTVGPPNVQVERVIPWSELGLVAGGVESLTLGPDRVAVGPEQAMAWYNTATREVQVLDGLVYPVERCDGLVFVDSDTLVLLDDGARALTVLSLDGKTETVPLPRLVPPGGNLVFDGSTLLSVDSFGNRHAIYDWADRLVSARGPQLRPPVLRVERERVAEADTVLRVEGREVARSPYRMSGRLFEDWLLIEERAPDAAIRTLVALDGSASMLLPEGRLYAPTLDLAAGWGRLVWMRPLADGLHLVEAGR